MSKRLPRVPPWLDGRTKEYLIDLVDSMDKQLSLRPSTQDGVLYITEEQPIRFVNTNGIVFSLTVDAGGNLTLTALSIYPTTAPALQAGQATMSGAGTVTA